MDLIKPGKCYDTYEVDIFNENFINHMNIEFGVEKYLWEKNFEEDWLGIWNFYISPLLCNYFQGFIFTIKNAAPIY